MISVTLPVLLALSWVPTTSQSTVPNTQKTEAKTRQPAQATETITCPITGERIPSCCCPVKT